MRRVLGPLSLCFVLLGCDKPQPSSDAPPATASPKAADGKANPEANPEATAAPGASASAAAAKSPPPAATATIGQPAPDFTLRDLDGKTHTLSQYRGKTVVLEWFNPQCPFVKYAHTEGPLKDMAATQIEQGVVWLSINSGAPGKQGHGEAANREGVKTYGMRNPVLLDEDGTVGHTYGAAKTPHVYLVDDQGQLVYQGAIDNAPFGEPESGESVNHLAVALAQLRAKEAIANPQTPPYGCTVKYAKG